jgi:hypothetical protein
LAWRIEWSEVWTMISCGISIFQHPSISIVIRINTYVGFQMFVERIVTVPFMWRKYGNASSLIKIYCIDYCINDFIYVCKTIWAFY